MGSNLATQHPSIEAGLDHSLSSLSKSGLRVDKVSKWWRSLAWPDPSQPAYLNGVVLVETSLGPEDLLRVLQTLEREAGRIRSAPNAPRTLDLDLIAHGRTVSHRTPILPHPRAHERLFVMGPLAEIAPQWRHPLTGETAQSLASSAVVGRDARPGP